MDRYEGDVLERTAVNDAAAASPSRTWSFFISNEQVLRRGMAICASETFTREAAIALADKIESRESTLSEDLAKIAMDQGADAPDKLTSTVVSKNEKIIVNFPAFTCRIEGRVYSFSVSATICQGETNSKIWIKITHYEDCPEISEALAKAFLDAAFDFYTRCAAAVYEEVTFEKKFWFDIRGAYTTDYSLTDVFQILQRSTDPEKTFQELRRRGKLSPLARLFKFASGQETFPTDSAVARRWKSANVDKPNKTSSVTCLSVKQSDALVLIEADRASSTLRAWSLSHSDSLGFDEEPPVIESATQVTGKLASVLAENL